MQFGTRWSPAPLPPTSRPDGPPTPDRPPPHRLPARLSVAALILLATGVTFLIRYGNPVLPFLILAVVVSSFWRFRAGVVCLPVALAVLLTTIVRQHTFSWGDGLDDVLEIVLLGSLALGSRALLDGQERQRLKEQQLIAELSHTVAQLRESERQQALAAQALAERHRLLGEILDSVDNGIFLVDPEGRIGFANERLGELLGFAVTDLIGQDARAAVLCPLAERSRPGAALDPVLPAAGLLELSRRLIELQHPDPRLLCEYQAPVRDDAGRELGCLYVYSDLPDRDRLQELLETRVAERTRELQEAQEQILRSARLAALGQFSATMAHELRNPLNVVKLSVHYVTTNVPQPDERLQRNLSHMNRSVDRACAIIDDLLAFSRLPPPQLSPAPINDVVREAVGLLSFPELVVVEWSLAPDLPPIPMDHHQIEQAVGNLAQNALQAMPEGGRLSIGTRIEGGRLEITVSDTGPGIPEELQARVFEPFFSTKATGTGLGLPLVREIALAHGGDLHLRSSPAGGACFTLSLPVSAPGPRSDRPSPPPPGRLTYPVEPLT
jgi:signal transduction histidine kinase